MNPVITCREREVLQFVSEGLQYKEIADKLYISAETVKKHIKNIYFKLDAHNKVQALNKSNQLRKFLRH